MHPIHQQMWEDDWDENQPLGWIILHDYLYDPEFDLDSREGAVSRGWNQDVANLATLRFRLYDDDGNLYYEGMLVDDDECRSQMAALDYGMYDAGCTYVMVYRPDEGWTQEIA